MNNNIYYLAIVVKNDELKEVSIIKDYDEIYHFCYSPSDFYEIEDKNFYVANYNYVGFKYFISRLHKDVKFITNAREKHFNIFLEKCNHNFEYNFIQLGTYGNSMIDVIKLKQEYENS